MRRKNQGFTLLEMLVALALFAVIYLVAHGTLSSILSGSEALSTEQRKWQQLDIVFTLLQEDLGYATGRSIRDVSGFKIPAFVGQATDTRAVSLPTLEFSRSGIHVLSTDRETGDRRVAYRFKDGKLFRETWSMLDRKFDATPVDDRLLVDVTQFNARFLNRDGQWLPAWPDLQHRAETTPVAVEISIEVGDGDTFNRIFLVNG